MSQENLTQGQKTLLEDYCADFGERYLKDLLLLGYTEDDLLSFLEKVQDPDLMDVCSICNKYYNSLWGCACWGKIPCVPISGNLGGN